MKFFFGEKGLRNIEFFFTRNLLPKAQYKIQEPFNNSVEVVSLIHIISKEHKRRLRNIYLMSSQTRETVLSNNKTKSLLINLDMIKAFS